MLQKPEEETHTSSNVAGDDTSVDDVRSSPDSARPVQTDDIPEPDEEDPGLDGSTSLFPGTVIEQAPTLQEILQTASVRRKEKKGLKGKSKKSRVIVSQADMIPSPPGEVAEVDQMDKSPSNDFRTNFRMFEAMRSAKIEG